ncbi:MAG: 4-hydroxybenzoate octaprenyltransferase [Sphingomonadales bacterium]|nr:4-hydroxybenzoate octaprenyltransferase [Sphingomonadales bacterium]
MEPIVVDTEHKGVMALLPARARDLASLARFDRPIGWWLLFWPCAWGVLLAGPTRSGDGRGWWLLPWLLAGSIAMRGAGCVYNDICDADIDRRVARTAARPVASGRVGKRAAWVWLLTLCLVGLAVLLRLRWQAEIVALASLALVALYPFMKRWTAFPQAWLGLVFTWGVPVGWVAMRGDLPGVLAALYGGAVCWCIGYDTIYALQDREDDALVGIGSSALTLGRHVRPAVAGFYAAAVALWALAFWWLSGGAGLALLALVPVGLHLGWQVATLQPDDGDKALARFRSNRLAGLLMAAACWAVSAG